MCFFSNFSFFQQCFTYVTTQLLMSLIKNPSHIKDLSFKGGICGTLKIFLWFYRFRAKISFLGSQKSGHIKDHPSFKDNFDFLRHKVYKKKNFTHYMKNRKISFCFSDSGLGSLCTFFSFFSSFQGSFAMQRLQRSRKFKKLFSFKTCTRLSKKFIWLFIKRISYLWKLRFV